MSKPLYMSSKIDESRMEEAEKLLAKAARKDKAELIRAAKEAPEWLIREAAVELLDDADTLAYIAENDGEDFVRAAAVEKVTDQEVLKRCVLTDSSKDVRENAVKNIRDQDFIARAAINDRNSWVRFAAVYMLTDQSALRAVAEQAEDEGIRGAALSRLNGTEALISGALNDPVSENRKTAADRIDTDKLIAEFDRCPGQYCSREIICSLCERKPDWTGSISQASLEYLLDLLESQKTMLGRHTESDYGRRHTTRGHFNGIDKAVSDALVFAYRNGLHSDVIKSRADRILSNEFHQDVFVKSCYGNSHVDDTKDTVYLADLL